jgi:biofilm PGA synthesis lipoprotein PgaB
MGYPVRPGRAARIIATIVPALIAALYLILPGWWQWAAKNKPSSPQKQILVSPLPENESVVKTLKDIHYGTQGAPVILTYHDIMSHPVLYAVTPQAFATQMQLLHDAGYHTLTAAQLLAWLHGAALPHRSVALTFDDGASGVWRYADPIMARYGFHGIAFIITGRVGTHQPYYMTWPQIRDLAATGRWDIESHTNRGHVYVATDARGDHGPFLTSLRYLAPQRRVETLAEYTRRVRTDLAASKLALVSHGLPSPQLFAYPFSAYQGTPAVTRILHQIVAANFGAAMLNESGGSSATTPANIAARDLYRVDVTDTENIATWVKNIRSASPLSPAAIAPLACPGSWIAANGRPARMHAHHGIAILDPAPRTWLGRLFAPSRTSLWRRYTVHADLGSRGTGETGAITGLRVLAGDPQQVQVTISKDYYQIRQGLSGRDHLLHEGTLPNAAAHPVLIEVTPKLVDVRVAGRNVARIKLHKARGEFPAGGIELTGQREYPTSPQPTISHLQINN